MNKTEFIQIVESVKRNSKNKNRKCMHENCNENAIKSHVLQKNGILKEISVKNHLFQFNNVSSFQVDEKGKYELKRVGINDVYTFPGFCKNHDSKIFSPIENKGIIDIKTDLSICLFSYRTLCHEIRRKEIALDIANGILETNYNIMLILYLTDFKNGLLNGIKNLTFFKQEFEKVINGQENNFVFKICEIPKIDICISGPLNIYDKENPLTETHNKKLEVTNNPFTTSVLNIFPYKEKSFVMISQHKDYECNWTNNLFNMFKTGHQNLISKLISDLVSTRFEFWCISPSLKDSI
ncbi:hypothetical protein [Flavobacterium sp. LB2P6]|uniref:hypothetical protein n=1 Tax=Flavobacterium sp. LB2P6 TaxID=3401714 RepID=UPI003AAC3CAE